MESEWWAVKPNLGSAGELASKAGKRVGGMKQRPQQVQRESPWRSPMKRSGQGDTHWSHDIWPRSVSGFWATGVRSSQFLLAKFLSPALQHVCWSKPCPSLCSLNIISSGKPFLTFEMEEASLLWTPQPITLPTDCLVGHAACAPQNSTNRMCHPGLSVWVWRYHGFPTGP